MSLPSALLECNVWGLQMWCWIHQNQASWSLAMLHEITKPFSCSKENSMAALQWQTIESNGGFAGANVGMGEKMQSMRAQVPGGWLVRSVYLRRENVAVGAPVDLDMEVAMAMAFVPDDGWKWR